MNLLRKLLMTLCLTVFSGCATSRDGATDSADSYEEPSFKISFIPERIPKRLPKVDISENSKGASIRVNWSQSEHRIADMGRYLRLKERILTSAQWRNRDPKLIHPIVTTGPDRDELLVYMGSESIWLQGSDVPAAWKRELIRLAHDIESEDAEQAAP
jgi:hypothetical protein